jgi:predicted Zn finger-like uncharacterized protein
VLVIVSCPNCDARYKLSDAVVARGARLKCAACDHRWVPSAPAPPPLPPPPARAPTTGAGETAASGTSHEPIDARWGDAVAPSAAAMAPDLPPAPADAGDDAAQPDGAHEPALLRTIVAVVAGLALSIIAAGLWVGRIDLSNTPYVGTALARLSSPEPLAYSVTGTTTVLPSGRLLLEVKGIIRNTGTAAADVPDLRASLSGPSGMALRWTIVPRIRHLPAGTETEYNSMVTGFPPEARRIAITPARPRPF